MSFGPFTEYPNMHCSTNHYHHYSVSILGIPVKNTFGGMLLTCPIGELNSLGC